LATAQMLDAGRKSEAGVRVPDWATALDQIVAQRIADTRLQTEIWRLIHSRGRSKRALHIVMSKHYLRVWYTIACGRLNESAHPKPKFVFAIRLCLSLAIASAIKPNLSGRPMIVSKRLLSHGTSYSSSRHKSRIRTGRRVTTNPSHLLFSVLLSELLARHGAPIRPLGKRLPEALETPPIVPLPIPEVFDHRAKRQHSQIPGPNRFRDQHFEEQRTGGNKDTVSHRQSGVGDEKLSAHPFILPSQRNDDVAEEFNQRRDDIHEKEVTHPQHADPAVRRVHDHTAMFPHRLQQPTLPPASLGP
jgi:hypothetical protein